MKCLKCNAERNLQDLQCPKCGVFYAKYEAYLEKQAAEKEKPLEKNIQKNEPSKAELERELHNKQWKKKKLKGCLSIIVFCIGVFGVLVFLASDRSGSSGSFPIGVILSVLALFSIISSARNVTEPGQALQRRFNKLGILAGKTSQEIIVVVGNPNAVSAAGGGNVLRQWQDTGYHIALLFDENDICKGITHEFSSNK